MDKIKEIYFSGGCYWSVDAVFASIKGVTNRICGMSLIVQPKAKIETVRVSYNQKIISFEMLLEVFFSLHNPTLVKWDDKLCIYPTCKSAILGCDDNEKIQISHYFEQKLNNYSDPVETKVFLKGEFEFIPVSEDQQNFYIKKPEEGFCTSIIQPKLESMKNKFPELWVK